MPALPWGLTPYGFRAKTLYEIQTGLETRSKAEIRDALGRELLNTKVGPIHQMIGIWSSEAREIWETIEAVHAATDPDGNSGAAQDSIAALTGTERLGATKSFVTALVTLGAGVTLPAGSAATVAGDPAARFVTLEDVTATGAGQYSVTMEAETSGIVAANAGTLTVIATPVTGWSAITNPLDAVQGQLPETDSAFRARRNAELSAQGTSPLDGIQADLLRMLADNDVATGSVTVFQNTSDSTDDDGVPPHAIEAVVFDGTEDGLAIADDQIAQVLWDSVAGGIQIYGTSTGEAIDAVDQTHDVSFTRPTVLPVYISTSINVAISRGWDPTGGADEVRRAIVDLGTSQKVGDDVIRFRVLSAIFKVPGVIDVTALTLGLSPSPVGTSNLLVTRRQIAAFDTSRVAVTAITVAPP